VEYAVEAPHEPSLSPSLSLFRGFRLGCSVGGVSILNLPYLPYTRVQFTTTSEPVDYKLNESHLDLNQTLLYSKLMNLQWGSPISDNAGLGMSHLRAKNVLRTLHLHCTYCTYWTYCKYSTFDLMWHPRKNCRL
jgi:hypothetical protein